DWLIAFGIGRIGYPQLCWRVAVGKREAWRHDTYHCVWTRISGYRLADDRGVGSQARLPEFMAEHNYVYAGLFFFCPEVAPNCRQHADRAKELRRYHFGFQVLSFASAGQREVAVAVR